MPSDVAGPARSALPATGSASIHALAAMLLTDMRRLGVSPTPANYDLWFTFRTGTSPGLTRRLDSMIERKIPISPDVLDAVRADLAASDAPPDAGVVVEDLREIAETVSAQVMDGQASVAIYGRALVEMAERLGDEPHVGSLVDAIATITAETGRASERNRVLERQLAASVARIDRLKQSLSTVREEAHTDGLTGLLNRRAFEAKLRRTLAQVRSDPDAVASVVLVDVDHFKPFNDTHGHAAGDFVLRTLARTLTDNVKGRDVVARYGGEEFVILLTGTTRASASVVAQQIAAAISGKRLVRKASGESIGPVTISAGVAQARPTDNAASLMERADAALYAAKEGGRNQTRVEPA